MNYSLTIGAIFAGSLVQIIEIVNGSSGTSFTAECVTQTWQNFGILGALAVAYIGRIRKGDVKLSGFKK